MNNINFDELKSNNMEKYITQTEIPGVLLVQRPLFPDQRGFFQEVSRIDDISEAIGEPFAVKQFNHSRSTQNTLRGIHAAPWQKLVTVANGKVQQVVVDLRKESKTFGKYISIILGEDNFFAVFLPGGCGNAFAVLSDSADYLYLASDTWSPGKETYVNYKDPTLNIKWEVDEPIVSEKDAAHPLLKNTPISSF